MGEPLIVQRRTNVGGSKRRKTGVGTTVAGAVRCGGEATRRQCWRGGVATWMQGRAGPAAAQRARMGKRGAREERESSKRRKRVCDGRGGVSGGE